MADLQTTPTYKLSFVLSETGLRADTVRVWEKRYGLPVPQRSKGGHRLYSRRDIRTLQWLQARRAEGMRISKAVQLWRALESRGLDPLAATDTEATSLLDTVRSAWLLACLDFDEARAEAILDRAFADHPVEGVCLAVLQRGLHDIGAMWYRAEATVQQEHFTAELAMRRLHRLMADAPASRREELLLLGAPAGEQHAFPLLLLAVLLRLRGWPVRYLGVNLPQEELEHALHITRPAAVIYAAQLLTSVPALQEAACLLREAGIPLGYGGGVFNRSPSLRDHIPGFFLGETIPAALEVIDALLQTDVQQLPQIAAPQAYRQAAEALALASTSIAAQVRQQLPHIPPGSLNNALQFTLAQWRAALILGDLAPLHTEMQWVAGMLQARAIDASLLEAYWQAWRQAVADHLGADAALQHLHTLLFAARPE